MVTVKSYKPVQICGQNFLPAEDYCLRMPLLTAKIMSNKIVLNTCHVFRNYADMKPPCH